ncbi:MAG: PAS domain S-box protein [Nitrospinae bacterium]|nr:PAS domain S-box protein [Nitrospinota bacterium]
MKKKKPITPESSSLRERAEKKLPSTAKSIERLSEAKVRKLAHELQVHQIELEMQNEELRAAQLQVEESRNRYSSLYDFAPIGYVTMDARGIIREANLTFAALAGMERGRLIKRPFFQFIHEADRPLFFHSLRKIFVSGTRHNAEVRLKAPGGMEFFVLLEGLLFDDGRNGGASCLATATDINNLKRLEHELETHRHSLEELVSKRTAQLAVANKKLQEETKERIRTQEDLFKARKMESLGLLAGGIAHDFSNILTGFSGKITLARWAIDKKETALQRLKEAEAVLGHARSLAERLLAFSRGSDVIKKKCSRIEDFLQGATKFFLSDSNVRCDFLISGDLWPVEVDEVQMSQVFTNLAVNAKEAMPGGGRLEVAAKNIVLRKKKIPALKAGKYVKISFKDNGPGIPVEVRNKIFDAFFTTKEKGAGLGLPSSYHIIKKHAGHIEVESAPGEGAVFTIYLPACVEG